MAVRGVYSEAEKKMIEETNQTQDRLAGWGKFALRRVATEESMANYAIAVDYWNPLWRDENYAKNTRWGGIIGAPLYHDKFTNSAIFMAATPECGFFKQDAFWIGEDWEIYKPVHVNDEIRLWRRSHYVEDITSMDGKGPRKFNFMPHDVDFVNQKDELVSTQKVYLQPTFLPETPEDMYYSMPEYVYSDEEMETIGRIADQEEIYGANIRYWEDVEIDEEPRPVIMGTVQMWDHVNWFGGGTGAHPPTWELIRRAPPSLLVRDTATGIYASGPAIHLSDSIARVRRFPRAILDGRLPRQLMARLVSNWMGDDGFLRRFHWRYLFDAALGDSIISRGKVINKRVEKDEYLVDLVVYAENLRGNVYAAALATVSLLSREVKYEWD